MKSIRDKSQDFQYRAGDSNLQLELLAEEEPGTTLDEVEAETRRAPLTTVPARQRRSHPGRQRLPEKLERVEEVVACAEQTCGSCGAATTLIGYDESEQLDVQPARYFVRVIQREKRACGCCQGGTVVMSPLAPRIGKGISQRRAWIDHKARLELGVVSIGSGAGGHPSQPVPATGPTPALSDWMRDCSSW